MRYNEHFLGQGIYLLNNKAAAVGCSALPKISVIQNVINNFKWLFYRIVFQKMSDLID